MTQVFFRCSNPKEVLVDRSGGHDYFAGLLGAKLLLR
jgi:hypothetical protein